ncbi:MAG: hypothetical protein IJW40_00470 [Clostridia bacterium]|nr:hypothetical protein [Clostridia bacterium]
MKNTIRAYLPIGGARARGVAWRLFLCYGIRPRLISRAVSWADKLFPLWHVDALPPQLPDDLFALALTEVARAEQDDRLAVLYLCGAPFSDALCGQLEKSFILRHADHCSDPNTKEASI